MGLIPAFPGGGVPSVTASKALVSDANGKMSASSVTATELGYVSGVTSAIQTQLNGKADSGDVPQELSAADLVDVKAAFDLT